MLAAQILAQDHVHEVNLRLERDMRKFWKMFLFALFLIYPTVSSVMVRLYACETVEGESFLTSDFTVSCNSSSWFSRALLNIVFIVLYPIGILALYAWIIYVNRSRLHFPECFNLDFSSLPSIMMFGGLS